MALERREKKSQADIVTSVSGQTNQGCFGEDTSWSLEPLDFPNHLRCRGTPSRHIG